MPKSTIPEHAVTFKGIEQGILILIDTSHDFEKVVKKAIQKIKANKKFLSENMLYIRAADGPLDPDELGMARKLIRDKTKMEVLPLSTTTEISNNLEQQVTSNPPTIIGNILRAGQEVRCNGDLILFGDTHPGSRIYSKGSVYVFGKIRGDVFAGDPSNKSAIIAALGFAPVRLSIGGIPMNSIPDPELLNCPLIVKLEEESLVIIPADNIANE